MIKSNPKKPTKNFLVMVKKTARNKVRKITKALLSAKNNTFLRERLDYWKKLL